MLQPGEKRGHRRLVESPDPVGEVADLHRADVGDVLPPDLRRPGFLAEPGAVALGTDGERHRPLHEGPDVRLQRVDVLGQVRLLDLRDQPRVSQVDPVDLDLGRLLVEQVVQLPLVVLADRLVRVEETAAAEDAAVPALHAVAGNGERALVERQAVVVQRRQIEVGDRAHALAARTHAAETVEGRLLGLRPAAALDGDPTAGLHRRNVERIRVGRADVRLPEPAEEDAQHRIGVGGGADGRAGVGAHALLIDDDRRGQPLHEVDLRPRQRRHEPLHESAVSLVDQPLRLSGNRAEHQRALARAGDAGEHRQPAFRDLDADVLEVVDARTLHADQIVIIRSAFARRSLRSRLRRDRLARRVGRLAGGGHVRWSCRRCANRWPAS